jgi:hypothetical protein
MTRHMFLLVLLGFLVVSAAAQEAKTPRFLVALKISGDSAVATEIEGCIKQELSLLKDVDISEIKPDYTINVIAMEIKSREQFPMGIAMTWLSLYHPKGFFEDCSLIEDYRLLTFEKEDIRSNCQKLVARFEAKSLEPHRKVFQKAKE